MAGLGRRNIAEVFFPPMLETHLSWDFLRHTLSKFTENVTKTWKNQNSADSAKTVFMEAADQDISRGFAIYFEVPGLLFSVVWGELMETSLSLGWI